LDTTTHFYLSLTHHLFPLLRGAPHPLIFLLQAPLVFKKGVSQKFWAPKGYLVWGKFRGEGGQQFTPQGKGFKKGAPLYSIRPQPQIGVVMR